MFNQSLAPCDNSAIASSIGLLNWNAFAKIASANTNRTIFKDFSSLISWVTVLFRITQLVLERTIRKKVVFHKDILRKQAKFVVLSVATV